MPDNLQIAAPHILAVIRAQHAAIDSLVTRLVLLNPGFHPTQSGPIWQAVLDGHKLIQEIEESIT